MIDQFEDSFTRFLDRLEGRVTQQLQRILDEVIVETPDDDESVFFCKACDSWDQHEPSCFVYQFFVSFIHHEGGD